MTEIAEIAEIAEGAEIADAQLKAIVSGELTTAEHKHRAPFDFHPFATCIPARGCLAGLQYQGRATRQQQRR